MRYLIAISILFCMNSCSAQNFITTSKKIESQCVPNASKWKGETFHDIRSKLYNMDKLKFINNDDDTLFLLESYEAESGTYIGRAWNSKGMIDYRYNRGNFEFNQEKGFTNYMISLVQKWDTIQIKSEEQLNANQLPERWIKAVRVIIKNKTTKINCISFKNFFKLDRDRDG